MRGVGRPAPGPRSASELRDALETSRAVRAAHGRAEAVARRHGPCGPGAGCCGRCATTRRCAPFVQRSLAAILWPGTTASTGRSPWGRSRPTAEHGGRMAETARGRCTSSASRCTSASRASRSCLGGELADPDTAARAAPGGAGAAATWLRSTSAGEPLRRRAGSGRRRTPCAAPRRRCWLQSCHWFGGLGARGDDLRVATRHPMQEGTPHVDHAVLSTISLGARARSHGAGA